MGFTLKERLEWLQRLPASGKVTVAISHKKNLTALYRGLSDPLRRRTDFGKTRKPS